MNAKDFFVQCLDHATSIINRVEQPDLHKPTPDTEWSVADLLSHTLNELLWVPDVVRGKTIAEVGNAHDNLVINEEVAAAWKDAATDAKKAVSTANMDDTAHLSYMDTTVENYLRDAGIDQLVHSWDLAQGIGVVVQFEAELAQAAYDHVKPNQKSLADSGLFAPPVDVPENVDIQTKLLALMGRSLYWRDKLDKSI